MNERGCVQSKPHENPGMRRIQQIQRLFKHGTVRSSRLAPCRSFSREFVGEIEGISSTWKPHGALKEHQDSLPLQPVPPLSQTMERFLDSVRPILNDEKYQRAVQLTRDFSRAGGEGERLQSLLEERAKVRENWLADFWIKAAYLGYRDPAALFVNPFYCGCPTPQYAGKQVQSGALIISCLLEHKSHVDSQTIPIEKIAGVPQCMIQYYHVLGTTRIPGERIDRAVTHHAHEPNPPRHITVVCNNNFFHVDIVDENNIALNRNQLEEQLERVITMSQTRAPPVGALTSHYRDKWYTAYTELAQDPTNRASMDSIHRSLFQLSLDDSPSNYSPERHYDVMPSVNMAGGGAEMNTGNRWCDKLLQLFVNKNGSFGFAYEHSVAEGPPLVGIVQNCIDTLENPPPAITAAPGNYSTPEKLSFNLTPTLSRSMDEASNVIENIAKKVDTKYLHFTRYGRDFAKEMKLSPDGFMQAMIQLAYYKMYGRLVSTYESGTLRKFRLGRTETIRSVSIPVHNWCKAMANENTSPEEKIQLLREATNHHRWYTNQASLGHAVDRHLLGLRLIAVENNIDMPEFLADPIYAQSVHWNLSTTTVPIKSGVIMFAPVVEDGYGIYYNAQKSFVDFGMTAWNTCPTTNVNKLAEYLEMALIDTQDVCAKLKG